MNFDLWGDQSKDTFSLILSPLVPGPKENQALLFV